MYRYTVSRQYLVWGSHNQIYGSELQGINFSSKLASAKIIFLPQDKVQLSVPSAVSLWILNLNHHNGGSREGLDSMRKPEAHRTKKPCSCYCSNKYFTLSQGNFFTPLPQIDSTLLMLAGSCGISQSQNPAEVRDKITQFGQIWAWAADLYNDCDDRQMNKVVLTLKSYFNSFWYLW